MARALWLLAAFTVLPLSRPAPAATLADAVAALRQECEDQTDTACSSRHVEEVKRHLHALARGELSRAGADADADLLARRLSLGLPGSDDDGGCSPNADIGAGLGQVRLSLRRVGADLEMRTSVGLNCATDESAALFHWNGADWHPYWRADYPWAPNGRYRPRHLTTVQRDAANGLVLATGMELGCSSNWQRVYTQLWRATPGQAQRPVLDRTDFAFLPDATGPLAARLEGADAYVEYMAASLDPARHSRPALRHYRVDGDTVRRLDPIALTPLDFVEEWLGAPWRQSAAWTETPAREAAQSWHRATRDRRNGGPLMAEFGEGKASRARRCTATPDLWQVAVSFPETRTSRRQAWFLVRWSQPFRFRLAAVAARPRPDCTEDADPQGTRRRLLPLPDQD